MSKNKSVNFKNNASNSAALPSEILVDDKAAKKEKLKVSLQEAKKELAQVRQEKEKEISTREAVEEAAKDVRNENIKLKSTIKDLQDSEKAAVSEKKLASKIAQEKSLDNTRLRQELDIVKKETIEYKEKHKEQMKAEIAKKISLTQELEEVKQVAKHQSKDLQEKSNAQEKLKENLKEVKQEKAKLEKGVKKLEEQLQEKNLEADKLKQEIKASNKEAEKAKKDLVSEKNKSLTAEKENARVNQAHDAEKKKVAKAQQENEKLLKKLEVVEKQAAKLSSEKAAAKIAKEKAAEEAAAKIAKEKAAEEAFENGFDKIDAVEVKKVEAKTDAPGVGGYLKSLFASSTETIVSDNNQEMEVEVLGEDVLDEVSC
ncbi:MAG: hypothetical protein P8P83_02525 [Rickettsiaceae bacterium]|nr:hypothetical protein [Rickettsiaceae bacterium]